MELDEILKVENRELSSGTVEIWTLNRPEKLNALNSKVLGRLDTEGTRLESILIELGLAEVPSSPPPTFGDPDARVWVDVHTGLYYCEGSELYGKTPEGRFTTQREAQQDQLQPASEVACK